MNIILNNQVPDYSQFDFPILVSGAEKTGSSLFSVSLLANFLKNGRKVVFFSAYPEAKAEFRKQIIGFENKAIIIDPGEEQAFLDTLKNITDLSERIVLIKNMNKYSKKVFDAVKNLKLIIFSGDTDRCEFTDELLKINIPTKIFFSASLKFASNKLDELPKYCGQIFSERHNGIIKLDT